MGRSCRFARVALACACACASPTACSTHAAPPASTPHAHLGRALPEFRRDDLAGGTVDTKRLRGREVVVKFFASYCEPCKRTLPAVEKLHRARPDIAFVGVDEDDTVDAARALAQRYDLTFPIVLDRENVLAGRYRVNELPATFVADGGSTVRWFGGPARDEHEIVDAIEANRAR